MDHTQRLHQCIRDIAAGRYSGAVLELTRDEYPTEVRELAEAVGMMMVGIESRQFHLEQLAETIRQNSLKTVTSIAHALGARDEYTVGHDERVAAYSVRLAARFGLPKRERRDIELAGLLHDIGKIHFSDRLFSDLDTAESPEIIEEIRLHPAVGYEILKHLDFLDPVPELVLAHHERMDGHGYPRGLTGPDIPLGARILAVADCFDAMTTNRSYRKGRSVDQTLASLRDMAGPHLDPDLVPLFVSDIEDGGLESQSRLWTSDQA
ncbi:MAG: HD-GYP domain-containing protein [Deltaproteobacteria bacterium]|nr:HD-GYP domain-containing protein [Deltaproteobacteria bacterium]